MVVRFQCAGCSQPIEVDDEWASRAVACPYCRKTITAPAESTLDDVAHIPTASPLRVNGVETADDTAPRFKAPSEESSPNHIAVVALVLACCALGCYMVTGSILAAHPDEVAELQESITNAQDFAEQIEVQNEIFKRWGGPPDWLLGVILCTLVGLMAWIAAVVCGIIGLRRVRRRKLAVAALVLSGVFPVFYCCGALLGGG